MKAIVYEKYGSPEVLELKEVEKPKEIMTPLDIVYDGKVWPRDKNFGPAYSGFRCVKRP